jgi:hypothetical protein
MRLTEITFAHSLQLNSINVFARAPTFDRNSDSSWKCEN